MTIFGIDYAGARPDPACLVKNGVRFVGRYLEPANDWKTLKRKEVDALLAVGIAIVGFYETSANRALAGFKAGVTDAEGVNAHRGEIGMPADRPVYFAIDFDASNTQLSGPITDYFKGIASVMPLSGIGGYGGLRTISYLFDHKLIGWGHQTYAWSRVAGAAQVTWDKRAHIQQYRNGQSMCGGAGAVDFNRGMVDDFGQWPSSTTTSPPIPVKPVPPVQLTHIPKGTVMPVAIIKFGGTPSTGWGGWFSPDGCLTRYGVRDANHAANLIALGAVDAATHKPVTDPEWDGVSHTMDAGVLNAYLGVPG